jgi:hypothetical protein
LPVHQKDFAGSDEAAALPDRKRTRQMILAERIADGDTTSRAIPSERKSHDGSFLSGN